MAGLNLSKSKSKNSSIIEGEEEGDFDLDITNALEKIATDNPEELRKILDNHSDLTDAEKAKLLGDLTKSLEQKTR